MKLELGLAVLWCVFICLMCLLDRKGDSATTRTAKRIARGAFSVSLFAATCLGLLALWIVRSNGSGVH